MCLQYKSFENSVGKGELACNWQFLLIPTVLSTSFEELSAIFIKFKIVTCISIWKSVEFVVWEMVDRLAINGSYVIYLGIHFLLIIRIKKY